MESKQTQAGHNLSCIGLTDPHNLTESRSFFELISYNRRFIKDFAKIAKCIHELTSKNKSWNWTAECDEAFNHLKTN